MTDRYDRISPTAKFVAYLRASADIPYAQEIAAESGAEEVFRQLAGASAESMVPFMPLWEARYRETDRILTQRGITQVLETAAGLSPRGLAMTENPCFVYVATDLPGILDEERTIAEAILARSNSRRPNLHFTVANALDGRSLSRAAAVFAATRPVAIVTEGLLPYLGRSEKETLARNIHDLLGEYPGLWITPDASTRQSWEAFSQADGHVRQRMQRISGSTGRSLEDNVFADESDIGQFFEEAGFKIKEYQQVDVLDELTSIRRLNFNNQDELAEILRRMKTLVLTRQDLDR